MISAIAAIAANRVLGKNNELLWRIPDDLKRFKSLTTGHPVIMGRKTYDSIVSTLGKPLPNRTNIVVTRQAKDRPVQQRTDLCYVGSIEEALEVAKSLDTEEVFVIGGAEIYSLALPFVERLYLTLIDDTKEGDAYFPEYEKEFTKKTFEEHREYEGLKYTWVTLERAR